MNNFLLKAEKRTETGSNAVRKLRAENIVPAELYQRDKENISLKVVEKDFDKIITQAGTSTIIKLDVEGEEFNVLVRDFQKHPYKNQYLHVDFLGVNMNEALRVEVPVVLLNRDEIYVQPSVLMQQIDFVEIETLPKYIPSQVELDVQNMQYNDAFYVKDLEIAKDENITILTDLEEMIVSLAEPQEQVISDEEVDASEVEVIGEEE